MVTLLTLVIRNLLRLINAEELLIITLTDISKSKSFMLIFFNGPELTLSCIFINIFKDE